MTLKWFIGNGPHIKNKSRLIISIVYSNPYNNNSDPVIKSSFAYFPLKTLKSKPYQKKNWRVRLIKKKNLKRNDIFHFTLEDFLSIIIKHA